MGGMQHRPLAVLEPEIVVEVCLTSLGYATEGAQALVRHAFTELDVDRIMATTMAVNTASRRVTAPVDTTHPETPSEAGGQRCSPARTSALTALACGASGHCQRAL